MSSNGAPRFSVMLPTRNGGARLHTCVRSVLDQDRDDIELIVADNASDEETKEAIAASAGDPRLTVVTSATVLPIDASWNRAAERSSGRYLTLLGDDDLLLPSYFERIDERLREHGDPDCLTCNGYYYMFPGVGPDGGVSRHRDPAWPDPPFEGMLSRDTRRELVAEMFRGLTLDAGFPGITRTVISRVAVDRLPGALFKGPCLDYYAMGALLLTAASWAYVRDRLVVLGVSPGSMFDLVMSGRRSEVFPRLAMEEATRLPGNPILDLVFDHLELLKADFPDQLRDVGPNQPLYDLRQAWSWFRELRRGTISRRELWRRIRLLSLGRWLRLPIALLGREGRRAASGALAVHLRLRTPVSALDFVPLPQVGDIGEFASWIEARGSSAPEQRDMAR
jgi:hypothetical protein